VQRINDLDHRISLFEGKGLPSFQLYIQSSGYDISIHGICIIAVVLLFNDYVLTRSS